MRIVIATPAAPGTHFGNRITALRWQKILRELGHRVRIASTWSGEDCDLLVALHAEKSAPSVRAFRARHPRRALVVALTGTDLYADRGLSPVARSMLRSADRIVVLQPEALKALDSSLRKKARVILQSASRVRRHRAQRAGTFAVVAVGHLRAVKDPLLAARAAQLLPERSRVRIEHFGAALDPKLARRARRESATNPRWRWRGERSHAEVLRILAGARAFVQTSRAEGGSSALAEAIVDRLPILCTRIPGAVGMLGREHPGYFAPGDARGLALLLERCERDAPFRRDLARSSARCAPLFTRRRERNAWRALLRELGRADPGVGSRRSGT